MRFVRILLTFTLLTFFNLLTLDLSGQQISGQQIYTLEVAGKEYAVYEKFIGDEKDPTLSKTVVAMQYLEELEKRLQALEKGASLPNVEKEIDLLLLRSDWVYKELYSRFNKNNANRRGFSLLQILEAGKEKGLWNIFIFKENSKSRYRNKKDLVLDLLAYLNNRKK